MKKRAIAVIGEGITEKYYIESLKGLSPFTIVPRELGIKASNLEKLKSNIDTCIALGYDEVYCLIDMDGKTSGKTKEQYLKLKNKYHGKIHGKKNKGIQCKVIFIETERCTELWFLYYFTNSTITKKFSSYEDLEKELKKFRPDYEKSERYFKAIKGIHQHFEQIEPQGSLLKARNNARASMKSKVQDEREYSYSEIYLLIEALEIVV